ncbi:MAG TPA: Mur ligase domain-containing protein, partial [Agriterribacter sp.]|nr:Mur ligase domain-containing protein [Agriterribacter sp.]
MAVLQDILYRVNIRSVQGNMGAEVKDIQLDSRKVSKKTCFIAIKGSVQDGHAFIDAAIQKGATAIIAEQLPAIKKENVTYVQVE